MKLICILYFRTDSLSRDEWVMVLFFFLPTVIFVWDDLFVTESSKWHFVSHNCWVPFRCALHSINVQVTVHLTIIFEQELFLLQMSQKNLALMLPFNRSVSTRFLLLLSVSTKCQMLYEHMIFVIAYTLNLKQYGKHRYFNGGCIPLRWGEKKISGMRSCQNDVALTGSLSKNDVACTMSERGFISHVFWHFLSLFWENGAICCFVSTTHCMYRMILQALTFASVPVSSERVSQHRHSDEERAGSMWAATEATYFLSGTPHNSKIYNWAWYTDLQESLGEVAEKQNAFVVCFLALFCELLSCFETLKLICICLH